MMSEQQTPKTGPENSRRRFLRFSAVAVPAVVTLRSAHAQAVVNSVSNCTIPVTQVVDGQGNPIGSTQYNTKTNGGPFNPPPVPSGGTVSGYWGRDVVALIQNGGRTNQQTAHLNYIVRYAANQPGQGMSCVLSLGINTSQTFVLK